MKLYSIHYKGDENNPRTFEGVTDNFEKWLEEHNSCREEDFREDADDFEVEEISLSLYDENDIYYIDDEPIYNHKLIENDDFEPNKECSQCDVEYTCWDCEAEQIRNRYPNVRYTDHLEWVVPK